MKAPICFRFQGTKGVSMETSQSLFPYRVFQGSVLDSLKPGLLLLRAVPAPILSS